MLQYLEVFTLAFIADIFCGYYLIHFENKRAFKAAAFCFLYVICIDYIVLCFVENKINMFVSALGYFTGTFVITKFKK